jgi:hypothetical protein
VPLTLRQANAYVEELHRHHKPARGCVFCIGLEKEGKLVGVAIVGRPVARMLQDGKTAEVTRLCTDGTPNACSKLYSTAAKVCRTLGYKRIITYILSSEDGASLKASGWVNKGEAGGGSWSRVSRPRTDDHPTERKVRWEAT